MKTKLALVAFALAGALVATWAATGMHAATQFEQQVEVQEKDEFGDTVTRKEWRPGFQLGLMDGVLGGGGGLIAVGIVLLFLDRRAKRAA